MWIKVEVPALGWERRHRKTDDAGIRAASRFRSSSNPYSELFWNIEPIVFPVKDDSVVVKYDITDSSKELMLPNRFFSPYASAEEAKAECQHLESLFTSRAIMLTLSKFSIEELV